MTWPQLLEQWDLIVQDFGDRNVDLWDSRYDTRPWAWFETGLLGLLNAPVGYAQSGAPIYPTRLGRHFYQQAAFEALERELANQQHNRR